ncbi:MAG: deoxyribodipyrimidine photolyase, partial [Flavobacteriales bacterium]
NSHKKYIANQENINKYCYTKDKNTFLDKSYAELSEFEKIPLEIKDETDFSFDIELPNKEPINIDNELPTFIYTAYNLDSNWKKDEKANRILLLEPSHYEKYPVSKKVMDFYILLSKEIKDLQIAVMEFSEFESYIDNHSKIYYKEHPFSRHFNGNKEERDWIFNDLDANGSFFNYWNKGIKNLKLK